MLALWVTYCIRIFVYYKVYIIIFVRFVKLLHIPLALDYVLLK